MSPQLPPLSLYIHMPWCVRKCPYCDFNSHAANGDLPEAEYIDALLLDLSADINAFPQAHLANRPIQSIFIGGGTPSLISAAAYARLFAGLKQQLRWADDIEITLEANPGTVEQGLFAAYREVGINRLSIGVQSFQTEQLQALGRVHSGQEALTAIASARAAGFDNVNLDLMHGLPQQSVAQALADLQQAIALKPTHLSWYQLTIEPNTVFYRQQPILPDEDVLADIQEQGHQMLLQAGFAQYEVSAYAQSNRQARHNLNYWRFGDYLGIGAGAHGKISAVVNDQLQVWRRQKTRAPKDYLAVVNDQQFATADQHITDQAMPFEFMLNALRLVDGVEAELMPQRTGLPMDGLARQRQQLQAQGLLMPGDARWQTTPLGLQFLNRVVDAFLPD
ncbi:MAG: radical SAM family heme chaperone HemW [Moraxellaceae bacterium]|nr:radical SAM family heme chaperone HemW [Moraxellaceae bacterium]MDZ4386356.1 radical SAM family heme chaperone HemW [Moraxellaceae bacterium]